MNKKEKEMVEELRAELAQAQRELAQAESALIQAELAAHLVEELVGEDVYPKAMARLCARGGDHRATTLQRKVLRWAAKRARLSSSGAYSQDGPLTQFCWTWNDPQTGQRRRSMVLVRLLADGKELAFEINAVPYGVIPC